MDQLITIETVPIKIEFVEKNPLALSSVQPTEMEVKQESGQQQIQSKPIRIALQDYYEPSMSYQWENSTYTATSQFDDSGNLKLDISMEDGEAKAIRFKQANRSIESMTSHVNSGSMQISIPLPQLSSGITDGNNINTEFLPPDLQLVVTQRADVVIKYVGGPIYVPPSSDPNYKPPFDFEPQIVADSGSNLDQKI